MIEGAFRLLCVLPDVPGPQQISGLAKAAGMPRPTVHRLIHQLQAAGAVQRVSNRWVVGPSLLNFVYSTELIPGLRDQSFTVLHKLRNQTGATVSVVVPGDQASRILEILHGHTALKRPGFVGQAMPTTAAADRVLQATVTRVGRRSELTAVDNQDTVAGINCVAVRVTVPRCAPFALQLSTPGDQPAERWANLLAQAGRAISARLHE